MNNTTRGDRALFNEWMDEAPEIKVEGDDLASISETEPMSWEELKSIRESLGYLQDQMSILLCVPTSTYQKWERDPAGERTTPIPLSMAQIVRIYYNVPQLTFLALEKLMKG